ncbi:MAG: hypothetical protein KIT11_07900 [Fimbriimonadaceae bacterium]|nr:hypothetical protein [Fimbriimonadaceae bacterium]QYK56277.1 MAG: hypothetical protein KF733_02095 [Fimbriimonadaceae bacterium]
MGKSTLARALSDRLGIPLVELDEIYWDPGWTPNPDRMSAVMAEVAQEDEWIVSGSYSKFRHIWASRLDALVWLDFPIHIPLGRCLLRCVRRAVSGETVCNGNRESLANTFFSRKSLLLWIVTQHRRNRQSTLALAEALEAEGRVVVRLGSPRATKEWLGSL